MYITSDNLQHTDIYTQLSELFENENSDVQKDEISRN